MYIRDSLCTPFIFTRQVKLENFQCTYWLTIGLYFKNIEAHRLNVCVVHWCWVVSSINFYDFAVFSKRQRITLRLLYAMSRPSVVCLSVCLWRWCTVLRRLNFSAIFFSPYDSPGTLLFWCRKLLVGDAFPPEICVQSDPPLSNSEISTNIGS